MIEIAYLEQDIEVQNTPLEILEFFENLKNFLHL